MVEIGMDPTDEVGIGKIPGNVPPAQRSAQFEWQNLFSLNGERVEWTTNGDISIRANRD